MKLYLKCLLEVILGIIVTAIFFAPSLVPTLLFVFCNASGWWFLLMLFYIPLVAFILYMHSED